MNSQRRTRSRRWLRAMGPWIPLLSLFLMPGISQADPLSGGALVKALQHGGYVLVMRHASSPFALPTRAEAAPGNTKLERQLDAAGVNEAHEVGKAIKALHLPIGQIVSSPAFRTLETLRLAGLGPVTTAAQLAEGANGMLRGVSTDRSAWLRERAAQVPASGTDTLIVTHTPNITGAFGQEAAGIKAGEMLVLHPDSHGDGHDAATLVARIRADQWAGLADRE